VLATTMARSARPPVGQELHRRTLKRLTARVLEDVGLRTRDIRRSLLASVGLLLVVPATGLAAAEVRLRPAAGVAGSSIALNAFGFPASKRVVVSVAGARARTVKASRRGTFAARLTVPGRKGWLRVMSRSGRRRVVNRFLITGGDVDVVEIASIRDRRVRFSPTKLFPGGVLRVHGGGDRRGKQLRLSGFGATRTIWAGRKGSFDTTITLPAALGAGAWDVALRGGGVRFGIRLKVSSREAMQGGSGTPIPMPTPVKPSNTAAPAISGTAQSGMTLSADSGSWSGTAPISYAYAWQRCDGHGANCSDIAGATAPTRTAVGADLGNTLRIAVTATNRAGSATATSRATAVVTTTPQGAETPTVPPRVRQGQNISVSPAIFTGTQPMAVTTQWQRCADSCINIGADSTSYRVAAADVGFRLQVVVTATNSAGTIQVTSNKTDPVEPPVSITGVVALWHLDDAGATMVDSRGNHDGALHNVATRLGGSVGAAFGFNGADSFVTVPAANDLSAVDNNMSVSVRMKTSLLPPSTAQDWDLIRSAGGYYDGDEFKMEYAPDGTAHCAFKGNGPTVYREVATDPSKPLNDGSWHTIQCVKTQTQVKAIVDGTVYAASATIGTITISQGILIGAHPDAAGNAASEFYNGALDEATIAFSPPSP
jgi:hypothetical protein